MRNARKFIPGHKSYSLKKICTDLGIDCNNHHRALNDALAATELFHQILAKGGDVSKTESKPLPPKFAKENYDSLPESGGVYYFYDDQGEVIYIGKSKNIKSRISAHFRLDIKRKRDAELKGKISEIKYNLFPNDLVSQVVECNEIKKHRPKYNVALKRKRFLRKIILTKDDSGYLILDTVSFSPDIDGIPCRNKRHAERKMMQIYGLAFGQERVDLWKRSLKPEIFNERLMKVVGDLSFPEENFDFTLEVDPSIVFCVRNYYLNKVILKMKPSHYLRMKI